MEKTQSFKEKEVKNYTSKRVFNNTRPITKELRNRLIEGKPDRRAGTVSKTDGT